MVHSLNQVQSFPTVEELSIAAAERVLRAIRRSIGERKRFSISLSGGNTPRTLYTILAGQMKDDVPWENVFIFFGDERYVALDDADSNFRMAREALLDRVPIPFANVHPINTNFPDPSTAASVYETDLRHFFKNEMNTFDVLLLGIGQEGHTASLFPGSPALDEKTRWVLPVKVGAQPPQRITLTYPILNLSREIFFLVSGEEKARAVELAVNIETDFHVCPAAGIHARRGKVNWLVDFAARSLLTS